MISTATPKRPLVPHIDSDQVGTHEFEALSSQFGHLPVRQHNREANDMIGSHAVFQAVGAPGIKGDVSADGANRLAGRIRSEVEPVRGGGGRNRQVDRPRFDHGQALGGVDPQDSIQPIEGDDDAPRDGDRATRKARPAAARHKGDSIFEHQRTAATTSARFSGKHDGQGPRVEGRQAVGFERAPVPRRN